jgi:hypothetical protein
MSCGSFLILQFVTGKRFPRRASGIVRTEGTPTIVVRASGFFCWAAVDPEADPRGAAKKSQVDLGTRRRPNVRWISKAALLRVRERSRHTVDARISALGQGSAVLAREA